MKYKKLIAVSFAAVLMGMVATESASATVVRCQAAEPKRCNAPDTRNNGSGKLKDQPLRIEYYSGDKLSSAHYYRRTKVTI